MSTFLANLNLTLTAMLLGIILTVIVLVLAEEGVKLWKKYRTYKKEINDILTK